MVYLFWGQQATYIRFDRKKQSGGEGRRKVSGTVNVKPDLYPPKYPMKTPDRGGAKFRWNRSALYFLPAQNSIKIYKIIFLYFR